ncbi:MAG: hypothetical protein JWQ32_3575 [Marmoricola sp.]|nr:hypothetical protein [Marmoricola sp.]
MKYTIELEIEVEDYAAARRYADNVSERIREDVVQGADEHLGWRFGSTVQVRLPPPPAPRLDPNRF